MERKFYYIAQNDEVTEAFECIELAGVYFPIPKDVDKVFIPNMGWVNVARKKKTTVPKWNPDHCGLREYVDKYGVFCAFYSVAGLYLYDQCHVSFNERMEFNSVCLFCVDDMEKYFRFVEKYAEFDKAVTEAVKRLLSVTAAKLCGMYCRTSLPPCYQILGQPIWPDVPIFTTEEFAVDLLREKWNLDHPEADRLLPWDTPDEITARLKGKTVREIVTDVLGERCGDLYHELHLMYHPKE